MYARLILGSRIVSAAGREVEKQTGERGKSLLSGPVCKHPPVNQRDTVKRTVNSKAIESINSNNSLERGRDANPGGRERETERGREGDERGLPSVGRVALRPTELFVSPRAFRIKRFTERSPGSLDTRNLATSVPLPLRCRGKRSKHWTPRLVLFPAAPCFEGETSADRPATDRFN